jgi:8-oxo-dGTP pyrophosphatase MutT (NUDIX family)
MRLLKFEDFVNERWAIDMPVERRIAAGVAMIYDNKILLVRPSGSSPDKSNLGIPKGKLDSYDEDPMEAALRELAEETSIELSPEQLDPTPHQVLFYKHGEPDGKLIYFVCEISDLSEIGLSSESLELPTDQLQAEEVSWGGFLSADDAYPKMSHGQMIILDRHLIK